MGGGGSVLGASFEVGFSHLSQLLLRYSDRLMSPLLFFYTSLYIELLDNFVRLQYNVMSAMFIEGQDTKAAFDGST